LLRPGDSELSDLCGLRAKLPPVTTSLLCTVILVNSVVLRMCLLFSNLK